MMLETRIIMGMPVTVAVIGESAPEVAESVFGYFYAIDGRFSTYKPSSEISAINAGLLLPGHFSPEMKEVLAIADQTRRETGGFFDIHRPDGGIDPSGIVKGWAIRNAARMLSDAGVANYFIEAGGDIQSAGRNPAGDPWRVGIRSPFNKNQIVRVLCPEGRGIATSGTYARGQHIYVPHRPGKLLDEILSLTVLGPDVLEADRFATAAFAMGRDGIGFIEVQPELEGYLIDRSGKATFTSGFSRFVRP